MYKAVTHNIVVTAQPEFLAEQSDPDRSAYFWAYTIEIVNQSDRTVQVTDRYWRIVDGAGKIEEVRGRGVVGEVPVLRPGETFRYTSGCPLPTPSGMMEGSYRLVGEDGVPFDAKIPVFSLDSPFARRMLN